MKETFVEKNFGSEATEMSDARLAGLIDWDMIFKDASPVSPNGQAH